MQSQNEAGPARWRAILARLGSFSIAHTRTLVVLAAAAPFTPGACQFIRRGIPDVLFTGDGATLELRTLHAAHGTQLLGAYSRFQWSHPGPAFFYLALPIYEAFHRRGPALNLFAFLANLASAVALTLSARRLRGDLFALCVATLLAVYECLGAQFQLSSEWNPITPILPLGLLSFLCARLGLGAVGVLPLFAFVASAIVQTHIGYVPVVFTLSTLAAAFILASKSARRRAAAQAARDGPRPRALRRRLAWTLGATACVLAIVWLPRSSIVRHDRLATCNCFFNSSRPRTSRSTPGE